MSLTSVTRAAELYGAARRERDKRYAALVKAIRKAHEQGAGYGTIAEAAGLSRPRVQQIVNGVDRLRTS